MAPHLVPLLHLLHFPVLVAQLRLLVIQVLLGDLPERVDFVLWAGQASRERVSPRSGGHTPVQVCACMRVCVLVRPLALCACLETRACVRAPANADLHTHARRAHRQAWRGLRALHAQRACRTCMARLSACGCNNACVRMPVRCPMLLLLPLLLLLELWSCRMLHAARTHPLQLHVVAVLLLLVLLLLQRVDLLVELLNGGALHVAHILLLGGLGRGGGRAGSSSRSKSTSTAGLPRRLCCVATPCTAAAAAA